MKDLTESFRIDIRTEIQDELKETDGGDEREDEVRDGEMVPK